MALHSNNWWTNILTKKDDKKDEVKKSKKKIKSPKKESSEQALPKDVDIDSFNLLQENIRVPQFIKNFVKNVERNAGVQFETVNIRVIGEDELDTLPKEILSQILDRAVVQEHYELASKVRDIINNK